MKLCITRSTLCRPNTEAPTDRKFKRYARRMSEDSESKYLMQKLKMTVH